MHEWKSSQCSTTETKDVFEPRPKINSVEAETRIMPANAAVSGSNVRDQSDVDNVVVHNISNSQEELNRKSIHGLWQCIICLHKAPLQKQVSARG